MDKVMACGRIRYYVSSIAVDYYPFYSTTQITMDLNVIRKIERNILNLN